MLIGCFSHSSPPLSFSPISSAAARAITTFEIAVYYKNGPQRKQYPRSPVTPTQHDGAAMAGYRDIRARTDTQGSTLMARATGGSSKVTYPRKPRVSFPFTPGRLSSSLWSFSYNLYLPTYVPLHDGVPAAANDEKTGIT